MTLPLNPWDEDVTCASCGDCRCGSGASTIQITDAEDVGSFSTAATIQYTRSDYNRIMSIRGDVLAGAAPYVVRFIINATLARDGDRLNVTFSLPASTNPTIQFETQGVTGVFATCQPDGTATRYFGSFAFLDGAWYAESPQLT